MVSLGSCPDVVLNCGTARGCDIHYDRRCIVQGKEQLAQVATAHLTSKSTEDSLARLNFTAESEVGINEQIK